VLVAGDGVPGEAAEGAGVVVLRLYMSPLEEDAAVAAVEDQPRGCGQSATEDEEKGEAAAVVDTKQGLRLVSEYREELKKPSSGGVRWKPA
jgi:hypothetical protein